MVTSSGVYSITPARLPALSSFTRLIPSRSRFWWPSMKNPMSTRSSMEMERTSLTCVYPWASSEAVYWDRFSKCMSSSTELGRCWGSQSHSCSLSISDFSFLRWCGFLMPIAVRSSGVLQQLINKYFSP